MLSNTKRATLQKMYQRINPLFHPVCYKPLKWLQPSGWIQHTPFAAYLISVMKPARIVELGTFSGVSYCAFCQAIKELNLSTQAYAIDTWQGDAHAGYYGTRVYDNLQTYHNPQYSKFSKLLKMVFDSALDKFSDKSIDLLHIDGFHSLEAVTHDYYSWLPKMSEEGVILFHDINVYEENFGVWKLWVDLKEQYPSFEFFHGSGLGMLLVGDEVPLSLQEIAKLSGIFQQVFRYFFVVLDKMADLRLQIKKA